MAWSAVFHVPSQQTMRRLGISVAPLGEPSLSKRSTPRGLIHLHGLLATYGLTRPNRLYYHPAAALRTGAGHRSRLGPCRLAVTPEELAMSGGRGYARK